MKKLKIQLLAVAISTPLFASWTESLGGVLNSVATQVTQQNQTNTQTKSSNLNLSTLDMNSALKEALNQGVIYATQSLGKENGYLNSEIAKISLPPHLQTASKALIKVGGEKYVNDLVLSINSAASKAAPKTVEVFANSISNMTLQDAQEILSGGDDAATNYFRKSSQNELREVIKPIISESMMQSSVGQYYKAFEMSYEKIVGNSLDSIVSNDLVNQAGTIAKSFGYNVLPSQDEKDLDTYVTNRAIDGLMSMIAVKEREIRENPLMQNSDIIGKVFKEFK
jgi:hypothetical protein